MATEFRRLDWDRVGEPPHVWAPSTYDSPLEHRFAHEASKYFRAGLDLVPQVSIRTPAGRFRLDFYVYSGTIRIAFECDGRAFHETQSARARDRARDESILAHGFVDVLYRLPGHAIWVVPDATFYAVSRLDPELFSERGLVNLQQLGHRFRREPTLERLRITRTVRHGVD